MALPTYKKQATQVGKIRQTAGGTSTAGYQASAQGNASLAQKLSSFSQQLHTMAGTMAQEQASKDAVKDIHTRKQKIADINSKYDEMGWSEQRPMTQDEYTKRNEEIAQVTEGAEKKFSGIYSRAYNSTASAAYSNQVQADAKAASDQAMIAAEGDSQAYTMQMKAFRDTTVPNAPTPETAIVAELAINQYGSQGRKQLKMAEIRADEAKRHNHFKSNSRQQATDVMSNMQEGDFVNGIQNMFKYEQTLANGVKEEWITQEDADMMMMQASEKGVLAYAQDRIAMMEEIDAKEFIKDFREGNPNSDIPEQFLGVDREKVAQRMEYLLKRETTKRDVNNKATQATDNRDARDMIKGMASGAEYSEENIKSVSGGNLSDTVALDLERASKSYSKMVDFSVLPLAEQSADIQAMRDKEDKTGDELYELSQKEKEYAKDVKLSKEDPLSYAEDNNLYDEPLEPLQIGAEDFDEQLETRLNQVEIANAATGTVSGIFTKAEIAGQKRSLENMTDDEKADYAKRLNTLQDEVGLATFGQLGGVFSVAGTHPNSKTTSAMFTGEQLLKNKIKTSTKDIRNSIDLATKDVLVSATPENRADITKSVESYLAFTADQAGKDIDALSSDEIQNAIEAVIGEQYEESDYNPFTDNIKTLAPFPGVEEEDFLEWKDGLTREDFGSSRDKGMTKRELDILKDGQYVFVGSGKYQIKIGNSFATFVDEDGEQQRYVVGYPRDDIR